MEEILASIRRIIEDNENTRPDAAAGSEPPAGRDPATRDAPVREVPLGDASVIEVDSFRQELRATRPSEARAPEPATPR